MIFGRSLSSRKNAEKNAFSNFVRLQDGGFTLIEMLVTIAVASSLMAVAVPSFTSILRQNRMLTQVNAFSNDLNFARSEAMREGLTVSVCPSSNGNSCAVGGASWKLGWIIFLDPTASGTLPNGTSPMRVRAGFAGGDTFTSSTSTPSYNPSIASISFNRDGFSMNLPSGGITLTGQTYPVDSTATRCVAISFSGRQVVQKAGTGRCT